MTATIYSPGYRKLISRLVEARKNSGLTQTQAGKKVGKSVSWLSAVERHQIKPDLVQFVRLCRAYGVIASGLVRRLEEELSDEDDSFLGIGCFSTFKAQVIFIRGGS